MHDAAAYWGDKVLTMTCGLTRRVTSDSTAFFLHGTRLNSMEPFVLIYITLFTCLDDPADALALAQIYFHTSQYTRAERLLSHPALLESNPMCQYLAALCSIKLEKHSDALQILGEPLSTDVKLMTVEQRKFESSLCHLRGVVYGKMSDGDRAKQSHVAAVKLDVACYESFNVLVSNHMLTAEEGGLRTGS